MNDWQWLLFENPAPLSIAFAVAALLLMWHGLRRKDRKARRIAPLLVIAAIGVWCSALSVTTPREVLTERAESLIHLTAPLTPAGLVGYFHPSARLLGPNGEVWLPEGSLNAERLSANIKYWHLQDHWIKSVETQMLKGNRAVTVVRLRTTLSNEWGQRPAHTDWQITWRQQPDGTWVVEEVVWLKLNGKSPAPTMMR